MSLGDGDQSLDALIAEHTEVPVGGFRLDIRAFAADGRTVAIENQYGTSDHSHLGQVITYASGVEADVVIWIAERFTDPRVEAIRWLNQRTDESCGVFAVRVEFVKIASSPPAPRFEVEARPSEWARVQRRSQKASRHWTEDEFLSAITSSSDREFVSWIIARARTTGTEVLWLGKKPGGQMNVHPYEFQQCAIGFNIRATGEVMVRGLWNDFATVKEQRTVRAIGRFPWPRFPWTLQWCTHRWAGQGTALAYLR